jgi:hypothetical protein
MKTVLIFLLCGCQLIADNIDVNKLADVIYIIEGGKNTKYPYGITSIDTNGNTVKARRICINTIRNTHKRWIAANKPIHFLDYLANRYCPPNIDKLGNIRWKINIRKFLIKKI